MNGWSWLRVLLPSWRFFDSVAAPLSLWVEARGCSAGEQSSEGEGSWREISFPHQHGVLCNPRGNLSLLLYSTLERLLMELADDPVNPEQLTSYLLVQNLAAQPHPYRFEIRDRAQTLLRSPWYQP